MCNDVLVNVSAKPHLPPDLYYLETVINTSTSENERVYTVLIVDDNAEDRYLLKRYLKKTDLSLVILEAENGQEGIDLLCSPLDALQEAYPGIRAPVVLFLDINMPIMNGWEFVEELSERESQIELKPTVVMMYSTSDADDEKQKATTYSSVASYIVKGESNPEVLRKAITDVISTI